ncbi:MULTISPECIES: sensor domain-containing diguanylate cyclase [Pseudanabaena]|uniref:Diguanylate cyclase with GAF sensor n=2 Tax=Pseudanabaena TaxID=1152 RepID=L8MWK7_9CYAN|nr:MULTISPECIES: sensor domain-containing diguanylate cyclase [Pseudanabaena]ELS31194.1 diguanylate cyclase with GAF sensor [Pseudanabaena biceps PCC 7429]MDG3496555.1 sensor domain-containing diguanylate cyclase [Pseudanabaena catenata USMAC16]
MKAPDYPDNEDVRIDALRSLNILDTKSEERFDRLTRLAKRLFGVSIVMVNFVDINRLWVKSVQGVEISESPRDTSFCGHAILGNDILIVSDALSDRRFYDNPFVIGDPKVRFYAGLPIVVPNGSKVGTLCLVDYNPRTFSEEDQELLRDLGQMAEQELAAVQMATIDELTQISNRRGFIALALHSLNLCKRLNKPASLFFFDLDLFKEINDRYGHAEGDRALIGFSQILKDAFRESDVIGRLGGDEFVVLLTNTNRAASNLLLSRLENIRKEYNQKEARGYDILCSVGVVEFDPNRHQSIEDLLEDGDRLMYTQKKSKRAKSLQ